jgi:hypothetical protein
MIDESMTINSMALNTFNEQLKQYFGGIHWHRIFFAFFLFSLPFSIRKVLAIFSPDGSFNEYMDISVYLSDILLIGTLIIYILESKVTVLSTMYWRQMFHVEHLVLPICIPIFLIFWSGLSIFWSENFPLAAFSFIKVVEGYFLYLYILVSNVPRGTLELQRKLAKCSTWNIWQVTFIIIIISAFFQSIVAVLQFIKQKSLGISTFNESIFSIYDPGVAKVVINGGIFIRSYGFFPHPNVLGGFLVISLLLSTAYPLIFKYKLFHVEHSMNIWLYRVLVFVQLLALLLSFSKSAILAFIISFITLIFGINKMFHVEHVKDSTNDISNVPRGTLELQPKLAKCSTWNISMVMQMFHVEHIMILMGVILLGIMTLSLNLRLFFMQPLIERLFYIGSLQKLSMTYYFHGLGIGQFVFRMQEFFDGTLLLWQFQPIHNVFLLIFSETGVVGLGLFVWFYVYIFWKNMKYVPRGTLELQPKLAKCSTWNISKILQKTFPIFHMEHCRNTSLNEYFVSRERMMLNYLFRSLLIGITIIMLFDHYFWDIQQGQLLLWIILALTISIMD